MIAQFFLYKIDEARANELSVCFNLYVDNPIKKIITEGEFNSFKTRRDCKFVLIANADSENRINEIYRENEFCVIFKIVSSVSNSNRIIKKNDRYYELSIPLDYRKIWQTIDSEFSIKNSNSNKFIPVSLDLALLYRKQLNCDLFVKLESGSFFPIIKKSNSFDLIVFLKLKEKNIDSLYCMSSDVRRFLEIISMTSDELMLDPNTSEDKKIELFINSSKIISDCISEIQLNEDLKQAIFKNIELGISAIKKNNELNYYLELFSKAENEYTRWHPGILSFVTIYLIELLSWKAQNTHFKMVLASYLHDITISNDKMCKLKTKHSVEASNFTRIEKDEYLNHPLTAANFAYKMEGYPGDIDLIISQHHEDPLSISGFPNGIHSSKIYPLSALFIIAHDFVDSLLENNKNDLFQFLISNYDKYSFSNFKKIRDSLMKLNNKK